MLIVKRSISMKESNMKIPFEIFNNIAALHFELGDNKNALKWCEELIQSFVEEEYRIDLTRRTQRQKPLKSSAVTVYYNYGIYLQQEGRLSDAIYVYSEIIDDNRDDIDCYLRIGMIHSAMGDDQAAVKVFDQAINRCLDKKVSACNARSMKASCCLRMGELTTAKKELASNYKQDRNDVYNIVALGNFNLQTRSRDDSDKLNEAAKWYYQALQMDPNNVYAANGIAVCLAELHLLTEAKLILEQLREVSNLADVWVNLGHIFMKKQFIQGAVTKYETALRRVGDNDYNEIAMYLSKVLSDTDDRKGAKKLLRSVLHRDPTNEAAWFHLAIIQEGHAIKILQKKPQTRTMEEAELAIQDLNQALATFNRLADSGLPARKSRCIKHAEWCKKTLQAGDEHLKWHRAQNDQVQSKRQKERALVQQRLDQMRKAKEARALQDKLRREELEKQAKENREKADAFAQEMKANREAREHAKKQRKAARQKQDAEMDVENAVEGGEGFDGTIGDVVENPFGEDFNLDPSVGSKRKPDDDFAEGQGPPKKKKYRLRGRSSETAKAHRG
eukprot:TRINITY_DN660_c0_g1_i1.p1 TRINITY_DN660_c0_g1~~TRINITY_DN660_c0_g1_i1.p1  ORF type:complete len:560 (-),score=172.71 TRINITY_DN660_c0_g1_i1:2-1681(-)